MPPTLAKCRMCNTTATSQHLLRPQSVQQYAAAASQSLPSNHSSRLFLRRLFYTHSLRAAWNQVLKCPSKATHFRRLFLPKMPSPTPNKPPPWHYFNANYPCQTTRGKQKYSPSFKQNKILLFPVQYCQQLVVAREFNPIATRGW